MSHVLDGPGRHRAASSWRMPRVHAGGAVEAMILFLVKFLSEEAYVRDLLDGKIYANRLSWFKPVEEEGEEDVSGRRDRHEGTVVWHQPDRIRVAINGMDITRDLAGPFQVQSNQLDLLNIFCMYAAHIDDADLEGVPDEIPGQLRSKLAIPRSCFSLGEYAVVIRDVPELIRRIGEAARSKRYRMWYGRVNYYDPDTYHGSNLDRDAVYWKQDHYRYQCEFRFVFDTQTEDDDPIVLEIGDIRDIALQFRSSELNERLLGI